MTSAGSARTHVLVLTWRLLGELLAEPAPLIGTLILAPCYLLFQDSLFGAIAAHAHGVHGDYLRFIVPGAVLVATIASTNAGFAVLRDENDGYLERLLTMPISRAAIVGAPLLFGGAFAICNAATVLALAGMLGLTPVTGLAGIAAMLVVAGLWGLAIAGFLVSVALLTKSIEIVQLADLSCFPFLFLSSLTLPREDFSGWLRLLTAVNPTTYAVNGLRALMRNGWVPAQIWPAFAVASGSAILALAGATLAARRATASA
jgi:ABC-2 type transport system permease protein